MTDLRTKPAVERLRRGDLTQPDRDAVAMLLAANARAVADSGALPSYLHAATEHALTVLGGDAR